jgi:ubiquinone/menaquinone biosynthesis C-methylase UbiE
MSTNQKTIDWYNQNAQGYAEHVRNPNDSIYHAYYEKPAMYALLPDLKGKKVLSLGCGSGEDSSYLKKQGAHESVGIDISEELVKIAKESHPDCLFQAMNMEQLDFPDSSFDFIYSSLALHYIEDWTSALKEAYRVLKPNSYFLFSCEHPIRSATEKTADDEEHQKFELAIVKYKQPKRVEIIGDYLQHRPLQDGLGNFGDVTYWHKPIGEISREIYSAGFLIEQFVEPKPLDAMKEISERDYIRLSKIPEFMIFKLIKL